MRYPQDNVQVSIVIPIFNEEGNVDKLCQKIHEAMGTSLDHESWEAVIIDDGSQDNSFLRLEAIAKADNHFKILRLARNFGQTTAFMAGLDHACGDIIVGMDGDGQNDPRDINSMLTKIKEGYDLVSGWRINRQDSHIRTWPSRLANALISWASGVKLHDYGCSLKAYRRELIKPMRLYGEMHRFIPIYVRWLGGHITEMPVRHHPREIGYSKYGFERIFKVLLDLTVVIFLHRYLSRPIYIFGGFGLLSIFLGLGFLTWALALKFLYDQDFILSPLPLVSMLCLLMGGVSFLLGLLAEILARTYYEGQGKLTYIIKEKRNLDKTEPHNFCILKE